MRSPSLFFPRALFGLMLALFLGAGAVLAQPGLLSSTPVGPGISHDAYLLPGPLTVHVLKVSLEEPNVRCETYRPDRLTATSVQAAANDRPGHRVLGAVNADFFSFQTGWPVSNQMVNGTWVLGTRSARSHLAIDTAGRPHIVRIAFSGVALTHGGRSVPITGVNLTRRTDALILYTEFRGALTDTDSVRTAFTLHFLRTPLTGGDTLLAVASHYDSTDSRPIRSGTAILATSSARQSAVVREAVHDGDTLRIVLGTDPPLRGIAQVIGGCGRFLAGGRDVTDSTSSLEGITTKFTAARHPRTFVGFDRDTTTLYICTVDGRQKTSIGMTFADMASFLISIGATEGFNLDGGGSTAMVVRGTVVNSPSDITGERPVANTLQVISTAPGE